MMRNRLRQDRSGSQGCLAGLLCIGVVIFVLPKYLACVNVTPFLRGGSVPPQSAWKSRQVRLADGGSCSENALHLDGATSGSRLVRERTLRLLSDFMTVSEAAAVGESLEKDSYSEATLTTEDSQPEVCVLADVGTWRLSDPLAAVLKPIVEDRLLPYLRREFDCPSLSTSRVTFLRYYDVDGRRDYAAQVDRDSMATAVVDLDPKSGSGLYTGADANGAKNFFVPVTSARDVAVYGWDCHQGVRLQAGDERRAIVIWTKPKEDIEWNSTSWYHSEEFDSNPHALYRCAMEAESAGEMALAKHFYEMASDEGQVFATHRLAELLASENDEHERALEFLDEAAERQHPAAAVDLGDALARQGDMDEAVAWFKQAALQGDCRALHRLGNLQSQGDFEVGADDALAGVDLLAAAKEHGWSQQELSRNLWDAE
eukprot:TRINITY_DN17485_c0_g1_i2.p1 TRINITY_DN17485_c0_g1~~TRINITY_DN17485_c0_g1_i2.p1  ORF type:complete len:429 (+),score=74.28 TRINITY_DN17485_c0_g1_i2:69-1355(+)